MCPDIGCREPQFFLAVRLLVVGHTYLTAFAQAKYAAMKCLDSGLTLRIVTPPQFTHPFKVYGRERHPGLAEHEVQALPVVFGGRHMTYLFYPHRFAAALREFKPSHVHIEEDPHSFVGVQTVALVRWFCPRAKISFFIWDNLARTPRFPLGFLKRMLTGYALTRAALVVCGNGEAEHLLKTVKGYTGVTAVLPQLGLDVADYGEASTQARVSDRTRPRIGFIGRLVPEKGIGELLEALRRLQHLPWELLVVGNGPMRAEIERDWLPVFASRMTYREAVPHAEVPALLGELDIFVLPSYSIPSWKEQFGLTLAQAMLAGNACIGTASGAIPEVLGDAGLIVAERDVTSLAAALEKLLSSESFRRQCQEQARSLALKKYTNDIVAQGYLTVFKAIASTA